MAHQVYGRARAVGRDLHPGKAPSTRALMHIPFPFRPASGARTPPLDSPPIPRACRFLSDAGRVFSSPAPRGPRDGIDEEIWRRHYAPVKRIVLLTGALLALPGLLGSSALAAVTTLHVLLEHHHHDAAPRGSDDRPAAEGAHGHAHHAQAPEHDHAVLPAADTGRTRLALVGTGPGLCAPLAPTLAALGRAIDPLSDVTAPARASPFSRRSVALRL